MPAVHKVLALESAALFVHRAVIERGGRGVYRLPVLSFCLVTADGCFLVDGGMRDVMRPLRRLLGRAPLVGGVLPSLLDLVPGRPVASWLEELGSPAVRGVLLTHLDYDHTAVLQDLPEAPVTVSGPGLQHAQRVLRGPLGGRFGPLELREWGLGRYRRQELEAPHRILERDAGNAPVPGLPFPGVDLFGDGTIWMVDLPGHAVGHVGYLCRLESGREVLLAGDAAFSAAQIDRGVGLGLLPQVAAVDLPRARATLDALRALRRERPELRVALAHDEALGRRARRAPAFV